MKIQSNIKLTRKELYDLVWSFPFTTLAKKYAISDVGLRKVCIRMQIPFPKAGHWEKVRFNKPIEKIKLTANYSGEKEVTLNLREEGGINVKGIPSPVKILEHEIILNESEALVVPDRLSNPDKLVATAKEIITSKDAFRTYRGGLVTTSSDQPHISICVTSGNISRALRFMDTFIKIMQKRGHSFVFKNRSVLLIIQEETFEFNFRENLKRIPKEKSTFSWQEYDYIPSGILSFNVKINFNDIMWKDGKLLLEKQLAKIIAKLEIKGAEERQERIRREIYWAQEKEKERIELEKKKIREKELSDFKHLMQKAKQWREATMIRTYLNDVETKAIENGETSDDLENWLQWARKKADWYDPNIESKDDLLQEVDKTTLTFKKNF